MSNNHESKRQENQAERDTWEATSEKSPEQEFSALRTLSHLLVGGILEGRMR